MGGINWAIVGLDAAIIVAASFFHLKRLIAASGQGRTQTVAIALVLFISTLIGFIFFIGVGGELQKYASAALLRPEPTLYETVNKNALSWFPTTGTWLISAFSLPSVFSATCVTLASMRAKGYRELFLFAGMAGAIALFASDLVSGAIYRFAPSEIGICFAADIAGGLLIGLAAMFCYRLIDLLIFSTASATAVTVAAAASIPLLLGLGANLILSIALRTIYDPTSTSVSFTARTPVSAYYSSDRIMSWEDGKTTPKKEARFGILTTPSNIRTGFQNTYVATSPKVTWNASSSKKPAKVSLEFYAACLDGASLAQIANRETFQQSWSGVHHFEVMVSKGQGNLRGNLRKQSDSYVYSPDKGDLIEFSIVDEKGKYRISKYLLNAPPLHLWNAYGSTDFSLDAFLVDERPSGGIAAHDRTFDFNIDGRHSQISVKPSPLSMHRKIGSCHALGNRAPAVDGRKDFYTEEAQFGVVVKIEPENQDSVYLVKEHDSAIMKTDGVLWTGELSAAEVARSITDGRVGALVINDGLDKISANGTDHRVEANEMIFLARSNVYLSSADGRLLNGAGTVGVLFKGQERLIRTRWELFGDLVKSSILAALTSLLLSAGLLARSLLSKNEDLYWTSL